MYRYTAQRLLTGLLTAFLVSLIIFAISRIASGDLAMYVALQCLGGVPCMTEEVRLAIREDLGLNRPIPFQYLSWIGGWATGNWGESILSSERIWGLFTAKLPTTLQLVVMAQGIAALIGIPAGIIMAMRRTSRMDYLGRTISRLWLALPIFWTATLLLVCGMYFFEWSPRIGYIPILDDPRGNLIMFIWPALILGISTSVAAALMMRSSVLDVLRQDYVQVVSDSGAGRFAVVSLNTLRMTLVPAAIILGLTFPAIVGGTLIVERIFFIEGSGHMLVEAFNQRDYPIIESLVLFFAVWVIAVNTLVDLACGWLTPGVRSNGKTPREEWNHLANPVRLV